MIYFKMDFYWALLCFVSWTSLDIVAASQTVTIESGEIVGNVTTVDVDGEDYNVSEYLGIPYAKAPVGDLRFRKPEPVTSLKSPFYATDYGAVCPQDIENAAVNQSEDCLTINVFVPERSLNNSKSHAVMIWIHGGSFIRGSANLYDGKFLAAYGNVIIVTFNYRLNVFGFLSTDDGNFGLWDQKMAFQWVHDNIKHFGGDNNRVTIFGESAGASSCMIHGLIPENSNLFHRIIAESGSATTPVYEMTRNGLRDARLVANKVGCNQHMIEDMMTCLRSKPWQVILPTVKDVSTGVFAPIVDGKLIQRDPNTLLNLSKISEPNEIRFFRSLDILSGFNAYDGAFVLLYIVNANLIEYFQPTYEMKMNIFKLASTSILHKNFSEEIFTMLDAEYTNWQNPMNIHEIRLNIVKLFTDTVFGMPAVEMAQLHKASVGSARHYFYVFTPKPMIHTLPTPSWIDGANHADEIPFVFGMEYAVPNLNVTSWEVQLSRNMMKYWTNFAKTGDPNMPMNVTPSWSEYNKETQHYMQLEKSLTDNSVRQYPSAREANFWQNVLPQIEQVIQKKQENKDECQISGATRSSFNILVSAIMIGVLFVSAVQVMKHATYI